MLKLTRQYFGHLMGRADSLEKILMLGKIEGRRRHKGAVICISEVTDISPGNLDSSLCFFQSSISHALHFPTCMQKH